jgi:long-chain acyl-CoA synthetase
MVHGDKHPHVVALLVPDEEFTRSWARQNAGETDLARLAADAAFHKAFAPAVDRVNAGLSPIERIRRYAIAPEPFTTENAMLTVSMKIRRHKIMERYGELLERLYAP